MLKLFAILIVPSWAFFVYMTMKMARLKKRSTGLEEFYKWNKRYHIYNGLTMALGLALGFTLGELARQY